MGRHMEEEMVGNLFCTAKSHCASATGQLNTAQNILTFLFQLYSFFKNTYVIYFAAYQWTIWCRVSTVYVSKEAVSPPTISIWYLFLLVVFNCFLSNHSILLVDNCQHYKMWKNSICLGVSHCVHFSNRHSKCRNILFAS